MICLFIVVAFLAALSEAALPGVPMLDGRIVGGEPTSIEEYPYQASLQYLLLFHICGAVVINENYVVTAAHCTYTLTPSFLTIRAGSTFRTNGGVVVQIETIYQHPNFTYVEEDYDISVLRLASPLSFGSAIAPAALPELNQPIVAGSLGQVSGWGDLIESGNSLPWQLRAVEVPLVSLEECRASYGTSSITDRMVCAGYPEGGKDACQFDSGGPLVVNGTLIGIVSWGLGCARPNYPGVYASVPALRDYITDVTGF